MCGGRPLASASVAKMRRKSWVVNVDLFSVDCHVRAFRRSLREQLIQTVPR